MSPVVACDLVRGFVRLGLRNPAIYTAACGFIVRGVLEDVDGGLLRDHAGVLGEGALQRGSVQPYRDWQQHGAGAQHDEGTQGEGDKGEGESLAFKELDGSKDLKEAQRSLHNQIRGPLVGRQGRGGGPGEHQLGNSGSFQFDGAHRHGSDAAAVPSRAVRGTVGRDGVWVSSGGGSGLSGLSTEGLVDLLGALSHANHYDCLLLDGVAQRLAQELDQSLR